MDKLHAMAVFVRVAELESFSRAADKLGVSPASVTSSVRNLEAQLGVRLLTRTTRKVSLTDDGRAYLDRCVRLLAEIEETEAALRKTRTEPQGRVRVEMPTGLGHLYVTPALPAFSTRYPKVSVVMTMGDRFVDLTEEEVDVIVRVGELADSPMVARKLCDVRFVACASPAYLAARGTPRTPADLAGHNCLGYFSASLGRSARWIFGRDGKEVLHVPEGPLHLNNPEALVDLALAGAGIVRLLETGVAQAVLEGRLVPVLQDWEAPPQPVSVMYWPSRHLSARVRVFVEFLADLFARQVPHGAPIRPGYGRGG
jgi:LysR family transcriptional regulator for bpeEF and oprC